MPLVYDELHRSAARARDSGKPAGGVHPVALDEPHDADSIKQPVDALATVKSDWSVARAWLHRELSS